MLAAARFDASISVVRLDKVKTAVRGLGSAAAAVMVLTITVVLIYLVKSALGINIFPGHSPLLHAALYTLVQG